MPPFYQSRLWFRYLIVLSYEYLLSRKFHNFCVYLKHDQDNRDLSFMIELLYELERGFEPMTFEW